MSHADEGQAEGTGTLGRRQEGLPIQEPVDGAMASSKGVNAGGSKTRDGISCADQEQLH
jgi:hypothetical protein